MQDPGRVHVGTMMEGVTRDVELRQPPIAAPGAVVAQRSVAGVAGGVVVTIEDDGRRSVMRAVIASSGEVHDLLASDDLIVDAVLSPDGRLVYYVAADRLTGDLTGAWRVNADALRAPEAIDGLVGTAPEFRLVAVAPFVIRLMLSPDGTTLGLWHCVELDCVMRSVRSDDGAEVGELRLQRGFGEPYAITDRLVLLVPICPDVPACVPALIDLHSGEARPLPIEGWQYFSESVIRGGDGDQLAIQTAGWSVPPGPGQLAAQPEIAIIDLTSLEVEARYSPPLSSLRILPAREASVGVDLPPGWILLQGSEPGARSMKAYALDLADGDLVPLPALGEWHIQG